MNTGINKHTPVLIEAKGILLKLMDAISVLDKDEYAFKIDILSDSSIGEHTRHIVELFQQLNEGYVDGNVNYDNRKRDVRIQLDLDFAIETIAQVVSALNKENKRLVLTTLLNGEGDGIESNYFREIMYNIDHCIHHQALIKIGLEYLKKEEVVENLGVAPSTILYKKQCAQ